MEAGVWNSNLSLRDILIDNQQRMQLNITLSINIKEKQFHPSYYNDNLLIITVKKKRKTSIALFNKETSGNTCEMLIYVCISSL